MIQLYCGEDTFESFNKCVTSAKLLAKEKNCIVEIFESEEFSDINSLLQKLDGVDMFSSASILVVKRVFANKKFVEYFTENFINLNKFDLFIWEDNKVDSRLKLTKLFTENKSIFNFALPSEGELKNWIVNKAKAKDILLSTPLVSFIFDRLQFNKYAIVNELEKLSIYLGKKNLKTPTLEMLEDIMGLATTGDIWKFLDYFSAKNKLKAVTEFEKITKYEDNSQLIISMIARELRLIYSYKYAKDNGHDLSELKLAPFIVKKIAEKAKNFKLEEVKEYTKKLFMLDLSIKQGVIEEKNGIILYLLSL